MDDKQSNMNSNLDVIAGRNAVLEALKAGRPVDCLLISKGIQIGQIGRQIAICKERGITVKEVSPIKLDMLCSNVAHQGIAVMIAAREYCSTLDILEIAQKKGEPPFIIIADSLEDPHNLGAVIRSAEAAGAHGVIIPARNSVGLTATVAKASAGAIENIAIAKVSNIVSTLEILKKAGVWIYCADMDGKPYYQVDLTGPIAVIVGSEGQGVGRLIKESCDFVISIPMHGKANSLNASVAAGIIMFEIAKNRY
jgi:23S rRNA (guanosine2251-2'-O)-methyltransferase